MRRASSVAVMRFNTGPSRARAQTLAVDDAHAVVAMCDRFVEERAHRVARDRDRHLVQVDLGAHAEVSATQLLEQTLRLALFQIIDLVADFDRGRIERVREQLVAHARFVAFGLRGARRRPRLARRCRRRAAQRTHAADRVAEQARVVGFVVAGGHRMRLAETQLSPLPLAGEGRVREALRSLGLSVQCFAPIALTPTLSRKRERGNRR